MYEEYLKQIRGKVTQWAGDTLSGSIDKVKTQLAESENRRGLGQRQAEELKGKLRDVEAAASTESNFGFDAVSTIGEVFGFPAEKPVATGQEMRYAPAGAYATHDKEAFNRVVGKLVDRGMPQYIAEGFAMNIEDESGFNPVINEAAPTVKGSRGGYGLYQLTGVRRVAFEKFAAERGIPMDSPAAQEDAQLDFLMHELQGDESKAWETIQTASNAGEAAAFITRDFLRPAEEHKAARIAKYTGGRNSTYITKPQKRPLVKRKGNVQ